MNITQVDIPNSIHKFKQFYTTLKGAYLKHLDTPKDRMNPIDVVVTHDNKNVKAGIYKDNQKTSTHPNHCTNIHRPLLTCHKVQISTFQSNQPC